MQQMLNRDRINRRVNDLATVAYQALELLETYTGNDYLPTRKQLQAIRQGKDRMEDLLQWTQNAPMAPREKRAA